MPLNTPQCPGQPHPREWPLPNVHSAQEEKLWPGSNAPACFFLSGLCGEGKPLRGGLCLTGGQVPALEPSRCPSPVPRQSLLSTHTPTLPQAACLHAGGSLAFYVCEGPEAGPSVETVSVGQLHLRDPG